jgi:plastocyanin
MSTPTLRRPGRALGLAAAGAVCAAALAACGSSGASSTTAAAPGSTPMSSMPMSPDSSTGSPMHGMAGMVMIENFTFTSPKWVAPGATVMVMNMDSEAHTVTADTGEAFDVTIPPGKTAELTAPDKPGSYPFHCQYHSNMHGTLRVR